MVKSGRHEGQVDTSSGKKGAWSGRYEGPGDDVTHDERPWHGVLVSAYELFTILMISPRCIVALMFGSDLSKTTASQGKPFFHLHRPLCPLP